MNNIVYIHKNESFDEDTPEYLAEIERVYWLIKKLID